MHDLDTFTRVLREAGDEMPPARLPEDLFRRGRRRRYRKKMTAVVLVLLLVPLVLLVGAHRTPAPPAAPNPEPAVPSTLHQPRLFQATVQDAPRGPASMLFSGNGSGLGGVYYESNIAVVGRDGSYRMLLAEMNRHAGSDATLSPDGSHVAMTWPGTHSLTLETLFSRHDIYVADLGTGDIRGFKLRNGGRYEGLRGLAWSPDGRTLAVGAVSAFGEAGVTIDVVLLDTQTGTFRTVSGFAGEENAALGLAFSADGKRLAIQSGVALSIVDTSSGTGRRLPDVPAARRLAGPGAWTPDGRLAVVDVDGCVRDCTGAAFNARTWRIGHLDPQTGGYTRAGFDAVDGMVAEVLGWQRDGDAVVLTYRSSAAAGETAYEQDRREPQLLALHPEGGRDRLITLPPFVDQIDVARDLVVADRFGGPAPEPAIWPIAHYVYRVGALLLLLLVAVPLLVWRVALRWARQ